MSNKSINEYNALCDRIANQYPMMKEWSEMMKEDYRNSRIEGKRLKRLNHQLKFLNRFKSKYFNHKIRIGKELREYLNE